MRDLLKPITLLLTIIFIISLLLKVLPILNYNFPFTMDQGRDMLDIRKIAVGKDISLIGPTTSINGVYLGPFWYYFNVPPFIVGEGNPAFLVYWMIIWYTIGGLSFWFLLKNKDKTFAFVSSAIFFMAPAFFYSSRFSWSANPMPYMTSFFFLGLASHLLNPSPKKGFIVSFIAGLSMQIEAAFAVLFFPFLLINQIVRKEKPKLLVYSFVGFGITLIPQLIFEVKHNFLMTKVLLNELAGKSSILGEKLSILQTFQEHLKSFYKILFGLFELPNWINLTVLFVSLAFLAYRYFVQKDKSNLKMYFILSFSFILFAFCFYMFYNFPLKGWYLLGLHIPYLIIVAVFFVELIRTRVKLFLILIILILSISFINTINTQVRYIPAGAVDRSGDPSNFRNELEAIDWVYTKANTEAFKVYSYIPSVYDFPYQYLFWWYGTKKYNYQPGVISYLDNVPEYITNNHLYLDKIKPIKEDSKTFLIIEPDDENPQRRQNWLGNFNKLCLKESQEFVWRTVVQMKAKCQ